MTDTFSVRIGHFAPDVPAVDFLVDGYPVLTDRSFGEVNDYTEHDADEYEVTVQPADGEETLAGAPFTFDAGEHYTLLLAGTMERPELRLLTDGRPEE